MTPLRTIHARRARLQARNAAHTRQALPSMTGADSCYRAWMSLAIHAGVLSSEKVRELTGDDEWALYEASMSADDAIDEIKQFLEAPAP